MNKGAAMSSYTVGPRLSEHVPGTDPGDDGVYVVQNTGPGIARSVCLVIDHGDGECEKTAATIVNALNAREQ